MTKRELIEALEALECGDDTEVHTSSFKLDSAVYRPDLSLIVVDWVHEESLEELDL
jgi:hypothetical protein